MADRSIVVLPCPGSLDKPVVLAVYPATVGGVGHPQNNGPYPFSIGALDKDGTLLDPRYPLELQPGQGVEWYYPPTDTYKIIAVGWKGFYGTTILEFDTPNV